MLEVLGQLISCSHSQTGGEIICANLELKNAVWELLMIWSHSKVLGELDITFSTMNRFIKTIFTYRTAISIPQYILCPKGKGDLGPSQVSLPSWLGHNSVKICFLCDLSLGVKWWISINERACNLFFSHSLLWSRSPNVQIKTKHTRKSYTDLTLHKAQYKTK